ncbi:MAG: hypothetical protein STSR0009_03900 [Methanoregula sp.]
MAQTHQTRKGTRGKRQDHKEGDPVLPVLNRHRETYFFGLPKKYQHPMNRTGSGSSRKTDVPFFMPTADMLTSAEN